MFELLFCFLKKKYCRNVRVVTLDHLAQCLQLQGAAEDCMEVQEQGKNLVMLHPNPLCFVAMELSDPKLPFMYSTSIWVLFM